jgi:hypothetical protein
VTVYYDSRSRTSRSKAKYIGLVETRVSITAFVKYGRSEFCKDDIIDGNSALNG